MKRILFFLSLAVLLTGCNKDKITFTEADLIGTWTHVKSVNPYGDVSENLPVSQVLKANHESVTYYSSNYDTGTWELNGRELNIGGAKSTIVKLDGKHLNTTFVDKTGTYTESYVNAEAFIVGTWTVSWTLGHAQYATFNADGTTSWEDAVTGTAMATLNWSIGVDIVSSRPVILYSGSGWDGEKDIIWAIESDDEFRAIDKNGASGIYTRGRLKIQ